MSSKNRGLTSLMRLHGHNLKPEQQERLADSLKKNPAIEQVYRFKQKLCCLLMEKGLNQKKYAARASKLLRTIAALPEQGLSQMVQLGNTLHVWGEEIATMCRFTGNNGITD